MIFQRVSNITTNIIINLMHMMCYFSQENSTNTEVCILIIARGSKIKDKLKRDNPCEMSSVACLSLM